MEISDKQYLFKVNFASVIVILYVSLYYLTGQLVTDRTPVAIASLLFLPAFARLLGFLVIGYWSVPALFIAGLFCVDLGLGLIDRIIVSAFIATGAPIGIDIASRLLHLRPTLTNLTPARLVWLSLASSFGNMVFYNVGIVLVGRGAFEPNVLATTFFGDALGTWTVIYVVKLSLTAWGNRSKPNG